MACTCNVSEIVGYLEDVKSVFEDIKIDINNNCPKQVVPGTYDSNTDEWTYKTYSATSTTESTSYKKYNGSADGCPTQTFSANYSKTSGSYAGTNTISIACEGSDWSHKEDALKILDDAISDVNKSIAEIVQNSLIQADTINRIRDAIESVAAVVANNSEDAEPFEGDDPESGCWNDYVCNDFGIGFTESWPAMASLCDCDAGDCEGMPGDCSTRVVAGDYFSITHFSELPTEADKLYNLQYCFCCGGSSSSSSNSSSSSSSNSSSSNSSSSSSSTGAECNAVYKFRIEQYIYDCSTDKWQLDTEFSTREEFSSDTIFNLALNEGDSVQEFYERSVIDDETSNTTCWITCEEVLLVDVITCHSSNPGGTIGYELKQYDISKSASNCTALLVDVTRLTGLACDVFTTDGNCNIVEPNVDFVPAPATKDLVDYTVEEMRADCCSSSSSSSNSSSSSSNSSSSSSSNSSSSSSSNSSSSSSSNSSSSSSNSSSSSSNSSSSSSSNSSSSSSNSSSSSSSSNSSSSSSSNSSSSSSCVLPAFEAVTATLKSEDKQVNMCVSGGIEIFLDETYTLTFPACNGYCKDYEFDDIIYQNFPWVRKCNDGLLTDDVELCDPSVFPGVAILPSFFINPSPSPCPTDSTTLTIDWSASTQYSETVGCDCIDCSDITTSCTNYTTYDNKTLTICEDQSATLTISFSQGSMASSQVTATDCVEEGGQEVYYIEITDDPGNAFCTVSGTSSQFTVNGSCTIDRGDLYSISDACVNYDLGYTIKSIVVDSVTYDADYSTLPDKITFGPIPNCDGQSKSVTLNYYVWAAWTGEIFCQDNDGCFCKNGTINMNVQVPSSSSSKSSSSSSSNSSSSSTCVAPENPPSALSVRIFNTDGSASNNCTITFSIDGEIEYTAPNCVTSLNGCEYYSIQFHPALIYLACGDTVTKYLEKEVVSHTSNYSQPDFCPANPVTSVTFDYTFTEKYVYCAGCDCEQPCPANFEDWVCADMNECGTITDVSISETDLPQSSTISVSFSVRGFNVNVTECQLVEGQEQYYIEIDTSSGTVGIRSTLNDGSPLTYDIIGLYDSFDPYSMDCGIYIPSITVESQEYLLNGMLSTEGTKVYGPIPDCDGGTKDITINYQVWQYWQASIFDGEYGGNGNTITDSGRFCSTGSTTKQITAPRSSSSSSSKSSSSSSSS